jgi:hypothetical protein
MSTTYKSLTSHQFKSHSSLIQALTHTERRVSRIEINLHWSVRSFRSDYFWEIIIIQISLLLFLSNRFIKLSVLFTLSFSFASASRICINFDQINTINLDQIEYQIITISFDLIESKCQKNNSRKDRFLKHLRDNFRDHSHSRDYLHFLDHDQLLSKNVHHHLLSKQTSTIKNFSESCEMNQARSWSMCT